MRLATITITVDLDPRDDIDHKDIKDCIAVLEGHHWYDYVCDWIANGMGQSFADACRVSSSFELEWKEDRAYLFERLQRAVAEQTQRLLNEGMTQEAIDRLLKPRKP
jgi:hypothetical protein